MRPPATTVWLDEPEEESSVCSTEEEVAPVDEFGLVVRSRRCPHQGRPTQAGTRSLSLLLRDDSCCMEDTQTIAVALRLRLRLDLGDVLLQEW